MVWLHAAIWLSSFSQKMRTNTNILNFRALFTTATKSADVSSLRHNKVKKNKKARSSLLTKKIVWFSIIQKRSGVICSQCSRIHPGLVKSNWNYTNCWQYLSETTQWENSRIFLPPRFYVKLILAHLQSTDCFRSLKFSESKVHTAQYWS